MLRPKALTVDALSDYKLKIKFDNGDIRILDVKPYIKGSWYSELADENYFKNVTANGYTIEWPHGQDLCPDEVYYNSIPE